MKFRARAACALVIGLLAAGCHPREPIGSDAPPAVGVRYPSSEQISDTMDFTGTVGAFQSVKLVARVEGYLDSIDFQDGAYVEEGKVLFQIEKDTYEQKLLLYQAQLQKAQSEYDRQLKLLPQNATSQATVESWLSQRDQGLANVALAKIELGYTTIRAPFSGLMGPHLVDVGNLVGSNAASPTELAVIEQIVPVYVNFNVNTRDALRVREMLRDRGAPPKAAVGKAPVYAGLETEEGFPHEGTLDLINNSVDTSTGTIQLRAIFPNEDMTLFPGLFARVRIPLGPPKPMLVVPNTAVGSDQAGSFLMVVNAQNVVERRSVELGPSSKDMRAIAKGIDATDRVIVKGLAKIRAGENVVAHLEPDTSESGAPATPAAATPASAGAIH